MATATNSMAVEARSRPRGQAASAPSDGPWLYVVTTALALLFLFPLFWAVMSALETPAEMYAFPPVLIPLHPRPATSSRRLPPFPSRPGIANICSRDPGDARHGVSASTSWPTGSPGSTFASKTQSSS